MLVGAARGIFFLLEAKQEWGGLVMNMADEVRRKQNQRAAQTQTVTLERTTCSPLARP
jgi:hypothetical protein